MSTPDIRTVLRQRIEEATTPEFLDARVRPHLDVSPGADTWETYLLQLEATGAATVEIRYGDGPSVFARFFPDGSGPAVYDKLMALRESGFGADSRYQVAEPLAWIPEHNLLLARGAFGEAVSDWIGIDDRKTMTGVVEAASWLARLHTSPFRYGRPSSLVVSSEVLSLARRLAKVAVERPTYVKPAVEMLKQLEGLAEDTADGLTVQSHGQYRPAHVYVRKDRVTVIDLDRSRPADPSRDVAEFLHRIRTRVFWDTGAVARAEAPTRAFLGAYRAQTPPEYLTNLRFQWARHVFHSLTRKMRPGERPNGRLDSTLNFYRSEFEQVADGRLGTL